MRPQGEARIRLAEGLDAGPGMTRELAQRVGLNEDAARRTLDNMRKARQVVKVAEVPVPGVRRPVPVYDLAHRQVARPSCWSMLNTWMMGHAVG